jgi:hypothetical protein
MRYPSSHPTALTDYSQPSAGHTPVAPTSSSFLPSSSTIGPTHSRATTTPASATYTTHNSTATLRGALRTADTAVHHFAHPIEFEVLGAVDSALLRHWPTLYVAVTSVDRWERHRVIGYSHAPLPRTPGTHTLELVTWKPVGSVRAQLQQVCLCAMACLRCHTRH